MATFTIKEFDMSSIKDDKVVVFIGKRETGKSFLVRDLLYYNRDIPCGTVISGTEGANNFYSKLMPSSFIHGDWDDQIARRYILRQKKGLKVLKEKGPNNVDPRAFFILDDCLYNSSWTKNKDIRALFMNGRHYKTFFLITMQYALGIPPNLRTNIDYVFILRENYKSNRKRLYEQYAGMFDSLDDFNQVMDKCTENYECIVINNNAKSNKLEDQVFWYKAKEHDDYKIGHKVFWQYHNENYDPSKEDEDGEYDRSSKRKKKGTLLNIKKVSL
jgi:hypothetical protein